jgi:type VI secretion system protein ImpL
MTRKAKIWLIAIAALLLYGVVAWLLGSLLGLPGRDLWILRGGLWLLGVISALLIVRFLLKRDAGQGSQKASDPVADDVDATIAHARAQLAAAKIAGGGTLGTMPMLLVLGPPGSTKTTIVTRSGLEPELLAGEVSRGDSPIAPTRSANVWYTRDAIVLEAGGPVAADAGLWQRLLRHVQPRRIGAVLGRGTQAPRVAVVCLSCEELVAQGASEAVPTAARALRARLTETARLLGVRLPVYVLFTKADRVPGFSDYVQNLAREETTDVLGATLPADTGPAGSYADRQGQRLADAFQSIYQSLAARRLLLLPREHAAERKPGAYEFPREFRKLSPVAAQFLVELCKPSQLQVSPLLRGFYFVGVQAVVVTDSSPALAPAASGAAARGSASDATGVFAAGPGLAAPPGRFAPPAQPAFSRKVPRWVFLTRLFPEVILADSDALDATRAGARLDLPRRALLGSVAAAALLLCAGFAASYDANRRLQAETRASLADLAQIPTPRRGEVPSADALRRLDRARVQLAGLAGFERDGPPLRLRLGLYTGSELYTPLRRAYFDQFDRLVYGPTSASVVATLRALPDAPRRSEDYAPAYSLLKAHLITTERPESSTVEFLSPVLMERWLDGRQLDAERRQLAQRQFDLYASELRTGNPLPAAVDAPAVSHARAFLRNSAAEERIYQFMLSEAAKANAPLQFNRRYPGSAAFVVNGYEVPGAFTAGGWAFVQGAFKNADRFFQGETWVLGEGGGGKVNRDATLAKLRTRYREDYVRHWRAYVRAGRVIPAANIRDGARRLASLGSSGSPLLMMLALAAQNTAVDSSTAAAFQPVTQVVPAKPSDKLITEGSTPYMSALVGLRAALEQTTTAPDEQADVAAQGAQAKAAEAKLAVQQLAQKFSVDPNGVGGTVQALLEAPITSVEGGLPNFGAGKLNERGGGFCTGARRLLAKYPFAPAGAVQASAAEVSAFLKPGAGQLWAFYDETLQRMLTRQGPQFVALPQGTMTLSTTFVSFFNRMAAFSDALYPDGSPTPSLSFTLTPRKPEGATVVTVMIDGQTVRSTPNADETALIRWSPVTGERARITAQFAGQEVTLVSYDGPWALLRLLQDAQWQGQGSEHRLSWTLQAPGGRPARVDAALSDLTAPASVLRRGYFAGASCGPQIAR